MNLLNDIITYVRRIVKAPSNTVLTDDLIIDYINRFWIMDVDARIQLFDLKTQYQFQTSPGVDRYNMPLYSVQPLPGGEDAAMYPVYQGFVDPCYINGIQVPLQTQKNSFENIWPNITQNLGVVGIGNGTRGPYTLNFPIISPNPPQNPPFNGFIRGHIDITGIISTDLNVDPPVVTSLTAEGVTGSIATMPVTSVESAVFITSIDATGAIVVVQDSGQFLNGNVNYGLLMQPGKAPLGNLPLQNLGSGDTYSTTSNTIGYFTGIANVTFPVAIPIGQDINAQCFYFESGLPRGMLYYNNVLTLRSPPDQSYLVELDAYLTPAAFFATTAAIPFAYMAEYIARGAARKLLSDTGDVDQFQFYESLFKEQEALVWKRSQRIFTSNRTETIYSQGFGGQGNGFNNQGGSGTI